MTCASIFFAMTRMRIETIDHTLDLALRCFETGVLARRRRHAKTTIPSIPSVGSVPERSPASQQPPCSSSGSGQHAPAPPPASTHSKPSGQLAAPTAQVCVQRIPSAPVAQMPD